MGVKKYFKREFTMSMFKLEHETVSDFYRSCFQRNRTTLPLLCVRLVLFLGCIGILITSMILMNTAMRFGMWFLFLTHWGLVFNTIATGFGIAVSARAYISGPIDSTFGLPWYVKAYWVSYNVAIPIAFFITLFYWVFLTGLDEEFAINFTLDVFMHGINSVVMFALLMTGRDPVRILHVYCSVLAGIIYLIFSLIFYFAGGLGPFGGGYIYPMLDWSQPVVGIITAVGSAVGLIVMHMIMVAFARARDALTYNLQENSNSLSISNERYN